MIFRPSFRFAANFAAVTFIVLSGTISAAPSPSPAVSATPAPQVDPTASAQTISRSNQNWNNALGFKSSHAGGCNFLFGDGTVRFLDQGILPEVYNKLGCRDDGKPTPDY